MSWLVFDCPSGISGDMTLGALVDLGVPLEHLRATLATLPLGGYTLREERVQRGGIAAVQVHVDVEAGPGEGPEHRHLDEILAILQAGRLPERACGWAVEVFRCLAQAEAAVHGVPVGALHFHEVGAVDAIVDIAGACVGIDWLCNTHGVRGLRVSQLRVGRGSVRSVHGVMPVPAPATLHLLEKFPLQWSDADGERATPTGAAILSALVQPLAGAAVRVRETGYGAGRREYPDAPNVLRLLLCDPERESGESELPGAPPALAGDVEPAAGERPRHGRVAVLRTTIDDMLPEFYGHLMSRLFASGALDVFYTPVFMKKDRPATQVTVIAAPADAERLVEVLFNDSSTLGVRLEYEERVELPRRIETVATPFGAVQVKVARRPDGRWRVAPEYESVRRAAELAEVPIADVYQEALRAGVALQAASDAETEGESDA